MLQFSPLVVTVYPAGEQSVDPWTNILVKMDSPVVAGTGPPSFANNPRALLCLFVC